MAKQSSLAAGQPALAATVILMLSPNPARMMSGQLRKLNLFKKKLLIHFYLRKSINFTLYTRKK